MACGWADQSCHRPVVGDRCGLWVLTLSLDPALGALRPPASPSGPVRACVGRLRFPAHEVRGGSWSPLQRESAGTATIQTSSHNVLSALSPPVLRGATLKALMVLLEEAGVCFPRPRLHRGVSSSTEGGRGVDACVCRSMHGHRTLPEPQEGFPRHEGLQRSRRKCWRPGTKRGL